MLQSISSKIQPVVSITDESYDLGYAHRYRLLIEITNDGATVVVLNQGSDKFILLRDYQFNIEERNRNLEDIFSSDEFLSHVNYKSVTVSIVSPKTTLVPSPFYDSNESRKLLEFNHTLKASDVIYCNYVRSFDLHNVFAVPKDLDELLKSNFKNFNLLHAATPFMEGVHLEYLNMALTSLFVNVSKKGLELMATNGKQLLFYNNFNYETMEDFAYYMLFVAEQLRINPELNPVTLSGNIQKDSPVFTTLYKYFRHVNFAERTEQYNYHFEFEKIPSHTYFSVFSQALCE